VPKLDGPNAPDVTGNSGDNSAKVPLTALLMRQTLTARMAALTIAGFTVVIVVAGGILARTFDKHDFHSIGIGLWWSLRTVTTVGYGGVVPTSTGGRTIGAIVMLTGIGFIAVITGRSWRRWWRAACGGSHHPR
jgi:hypothetical protein